MAILDSSLNSNHTTMKSPFIKLFRYYSGWFYHLFSICNLAKTHSNLNLFLFSKHFYLFILILRMSPHHFPPSSSNPFSLKDLQYIPKKGYMGMNFLRPWFSWYYSQSHPLSYSCILVPNLTSSTASHDFWLWLFVVLAKKIFTVRGTLFLYLE